MKPVFLCCAAFLVSLCTGPAAESRFKEYTRKFSHAPDRAEVVCSTFLGSSGTEWLAGGGFQPDGTIVAAGVTLGPQFDLSTNVVVLGNEGTLQGAVSRQVFRNGRPVKNPDGTLKMDPLGWNNPNATAFIVRLSPDGKTILSVTRLGWRRGGLTGAAVDGEGNIYICGPANGGIESLSTDTQTLTAKNTPQILNGCAAVYLAKLTPDASKATWVRVVSGMSQAPSLRLGKSGTVYLQAANLRAFNANGKDVSAVEITGGIEGHFAVNPNDGSFARGGEHHWTTGREPYRDPTLNIFKPDGALLYELYNWDGPFVGLNGLRLVSDSAIRGLWYDDDGNLLIHAWSDGGNSVMYREPNDVFTASKRMTGLGFSAWGAGVLSCSYIIRLDAKSWKVADGTLWASYLDDRNKPNSITVNSMATARDGSVCIGGSSAYGLITTGNAFPGEPNGSYVAVLSKDLSSLRFCSTLPGTGQTFINDTARWGVASGMAKGKELALFFSGATRGEGNRTTPVVNARQEQFAGGLSDGHLLLLDLSNAKP